MHNTPVLLIIPAVLAAGYAADRWNRRPAARARWATLSLREKIARQVRLARIAVAVQVAWLMLLTALWLLASILPFSSWVVDVAVSGFYLAVNPLRRLWRALSARRAYNKLGPMAYIAEMRHTFGTM